MGLRETIAAAVMAELETDPEGRGYAGKTQEEQLELLNESYTVQVITEEVRPARINQILIGVAGAPNQISAEDFALVQEQLNG
jgi:hypothetical protein